MVECTGTYLYLRGRVVVFDWPSVQDKNSLEKEVIEIRKQQTVIKQQILVKQYYNKIILQSNYTKQKIIIETKKQETSVILWLLEWTENEDNPTLIRVFHIF